jgi:hypothetical protein
MSAMQRYSPSPFTSILDGFFPFHSMHLDLFYRAFWSSHLLGFFLVSSFSSRTKHVFAHHRLLVTSSLKDNLTLRQLAPTTPLRVGSHCLVDRIVPSPPRSQALFSSSLPSWILCLSRNVYHFASKQPPRLLSILPLLFSAVFFFFPYLILISLLCRPILILGHLPTSPFFFFLHDFSSRPGVRNPLASFFDHDYPCIQYIACVSTRRSKFSPSCTFFPPGFPPRPYPSST